MGKRFKNLLKTNRIIFVANKYNTRKIFAFIVLFCFALNVKSQSFQDTIPFRTDLGLIIIPVTFNGVEKQFAFDTGAQLSVAYGWAKEDLKRTNKTITINSSSGLKSKMRYYKSGKIELGSRKITGHRILNAPRNDIFTCYNVDGILGVDITDQLNWTIDYEKKILIMYPSNYFPEKVKQMSELDFEFKSNRPYVYLTRKGSKFRFLLDTGAGGNSNISKKNYTLTNLDEYPQLSFYSGGFDVNGILTPEKPIIFKFPQSRSDDVLLSPIIEYNNKKSTKIGNRLWKGKELFLSLKNKRLFVSSSSIDQDYSGYPCGVMFQKGKMRISTIQIGGELWNMGVRQGDEIRSYNGRSFTDFCSLDQFRREVAKSSDSFELELMNRKKVTISKKKGL
jgi:hypothetical protein